MSRQTICFIGLIILFVIVGLGYTQAQPTTKGSLKKTEDKVKTDFSEYKTGKVDVYSVEKGEIIEIQKVYQEDEHWKKVLSQQEFDIAFRQGTERPFTGKLNANKKSGVYRSKVSGNDLFHSDHKFDSGTGWPSFYQPVHEKNILLVEDNSLFSKRIEVVDRVSGAHLGHVFKDGPPPTGLRYCINSDALEFVENVAYKEPKAENK